MNKVDQLIENYKNIQQQEEQLKEEKAKLKDAILLELANLGEATHTNESGTKASIVDKVTFKYTNESGLKEYLGNHNLGVFLVETVDSKNLNSMLKTNNGLLEDLSKFVEKQQQTTLTVK